MDQSGSRSATSPDAVDRPGQAHVVGIGENGMTGLAQLLVQTGFTVSASGPGGSSTLAAAGLGGLGIRVHEPHNAIRLPRSARLLVYGPAVQRVDADRLRALRFGVPQASSSDVVNRLLATSLGIAVLGGRPASETAAMIGWMLVQAGQDPTVLLAQQSPQLGGWGRLGTGPCCVVEADSRLGTIEPELLRMAVIFGMGPGFPASGQDRADQVRRFASALPKTGYVLGTGQIQWVASALQGIPAAVELFSLENGRAWWGADLREDAGRYRFRVFYRGRFVLEAKLQVPGKHQVQSALAAVAVCHRLDLPAASIREALEEFTGLERELESKGSWRGVTLVDDSAPDPRGVAEALATCRQVFGRRRLWSVVRPETPAAWVPFASAFAAADQVLVAERGPGRTAEGWHLVRSLASAGVSARWAADLAEAVAALQQHLEPGDVLLTVGSGDVGTIVDALSTRKPPRDHHGL